MTIDVKAPAVSSKNDTLEATFENLHPGRKYTFTVTAKAGGTTLAATLPDAVKNTNLKIIHRLISKDDIEIVSKSMGISEKQQEIIPKLGIGQAVVAGIYLGNNSINSTENIYWCKIKQIKSN